MTAAILAGVLLAAAVLVSPGRDERDDEALERSEARVGERGQKLPEAPRADDVASALVLLALGYRSGLPTWQVLGAVADVLTVAGPSARPTAPSRRSARRAAQRPTAAPTARDLRQVAAALRWGASEAEAWASVDPEWSGAGRAVAIAHRAGIAPGPLLLAAADDLRRASLEQVELAAARVGVRLVAPLGLVLLPAFCLTTVVPLVVALARQMLAS